MSTNQSPLPSTNPFASSANVIRTSAADAPAVSTAVNILLHGFFFMEFQNDTLVAASPAFSDHHFLLRDHGSATLQPIQNPVDLRKTLNPGTVLDFTSDMVLRFARKDIGLADNQFFIDPGKTYGALLLLPRPAQILTLRLGLFANFHPVTSGKVAQSIIKNHDSQQSSALIACLQYTTTGGAAGFTRSYYAEHSHDPQPQEVNAALAAATNVFGAAFDLQVTNQIDNKVVPLDDPASLPGSVSPDDENDLQDLMGGAMRMHHPGAVVRQAIEVGTCPQFAIVA